MFHPKQSTRVRGVNKVYDERYIYACNACPRRFREKKCLNFHINAMLRQKQFKCGFCSKVFFRKYHRGRYLNICPERKSSKESETGKEMEIDVAEFIRENVCFVKLDRCDAEPTTEMPDLPDLTNGMKRLF